MLNIQISQLAQKIIDGYELTYEDALKLSQIKEAALEDLLFCADRIRKYFKGNSIHLCSIINAKSGRCSEDCRFCAQSGHYHTQVKEYPLLEEEKLLEGAEAANAAGASCYGIVTSGRTIWGNGELERICLAIRQLREKGEITPSASLGELTPQMAKKLKEAGLVRYHHNLETSERIFPRICTTHSYQDRLATIRLAKSYGFEVCCGGIFGLGEEMEDRLQFAFTLRELGVNSAPLNFLVPIPDTPLEHQPPLNPREILQTIALFRFILPQQDIKVCGGREKHLRDLQSCFCRRQRHSDR